MDLDRYEVGPELGRGGYGVVLGYLPARVVKHLAPLIDGGAVTVEVRIHSEGKG